jgi:thiol:disulfide interchange protein DsbD
MFLGITDMSRAQNNPVRWNYSAQKLDDKTYEIHLKAVIQFPWHIYAQQNLEDLGLPTAIKFNTNPLIALVGNTQEIGKLEIEKLAEIDGTLKYYENEVDFVQKVQLKNIIKTNISGSISFQACTDSHCLPPAETHFNVAL